MWLVFDERKKKKNHRELSCLAGLALRKGSWQAGFDVSHLSHGGHLPSMERTCK